MNDQSLHGTPPLGWLRVEIDRSIDAARQHLASALARRPERDKELIAGATQIRQVRGALTMLCMEGAARFCQVLEDAISSFTDAAAGLTELSASAIDRALFALRQYLADVAQGEADVPLKLFPLYKELNELCGQSTCSEVDLFFPDLSRAPAVSTRAPHIHPSTRAAHLTACSTLFQRGLVSWLREQSRLDGVGMMRTAVDGVQRATGTIDLHPALWWSVAGLIDVLAFPDVRVDPAQIKATLGRIERAIRAVAAGTSVDSPALMREILYPISLAQPVTERVREIKAFYRLDDQIPEFCVSGTLEYDVRALAPVLDEMRRVLERIKQFWSGYAAGGPGGLGALREQLQLLKATARDLGHYRLVRLIDIVAMVASKLPEKFHPQHDSVTLEMAAVFLFMDGMLDHFTDPPPDIDQQVAVIAGWLLDAAKSRSGRAPRAPPRDDVTQRQHVADTRIQVIAEIQENMLRVETLVEAVARDEVPGSRIAETRKPLDQVAGALKMLGLNRANGVLSVCNHLLGICASADVHLRHTTLEWVADGMSSLGFYLDALRRGIPTNDSLLINYVDRLTNDSESPAGSTGWIPASIDLAQLSETRDEPLEISIAVDVSEFELPPPAEAAAVTAVPAIDEPEPDCARKAFASYPLPASDPAPVAEPPDASAAGAKRHDDRIEPLSEPTHDPGSPPAEPGTTPASDEPDASLLPVFLDEARGLLAHLYSELAAWRAAPGDILSARAFARTLHTLKGSARLVGAMHLGEFTHSVESYVGNSIEAGQRDGRAFDFAPLQQMLVSIAEQIGALGSTIERSRPASDNTRAAAQPPAAASTDSLDAPTTVRVPISLLNGLVNHAGELSEVRARTEDEMGTLRRALHELAETVARLRTQLGEMEKESERPEAASPDGDSEDASEQDRRMRIQELSRAMTESLHDVQTLQQGLVISCADTEAALALQSRLDLGLRHKLLEIRSLPFGSLAERLRRTVRQTAAQLSKEAELHIEGDTVAIDRTVLQRLAAPLEHMLRNAVAHGIEPVAARISAAKAPVGSIRLVIEQSEDENMLTLTDDGAGLDIEQILAQAVNLGLVAAGETIPDRMLYSLIFAPGLSTASTVTAASGRGVGLDVVRAEIRAIGGSIEVSSERGGGACFRIRFPTSLSYTQALIVRSAGRMYAFPATLVEQVYELPSDALQAARDDGRIAWNGQDYRFADLARLLGSHGPSPAPRRSNSVLLLHGDGERAAVHVEQVVRKQAIELKNIGPQLARVRGIAGATIIGKGDVVFILDPDELVMHAAHRLAREARQAPAPVQDPPPVILVVDDSLTMRRVTARLLTRAGYRVLVARDGVDAVQQIEEITPDLVIADIEMPNMDGFELMSHLRSNPRTDRIPIIVVTSLIAEKHQRRAADLGVEAFLGKPYAEELLLANVAELLGRRTPQAAAVTLAGIAAIG